MAEARRWKIRRQRADEGDSTKMELRQTAGDPLKHDEEIEVAERPYDSRPDTYRHIAEVRGLVLGAAGSLIRRAHVHDQSKLVPPELDGFNEHTPALDQHSYDSPEYRAHLKAMKETTLDHHYKANSHHPEHWPNGIADMSLLEVIEMLCDWIAASRRHPDGDVMESIRKNAERFGYGPEMQRLLVNSVKPLLLREEEMRVLERPVDQRAWKCERCDQLNSAWTDACGRCGAPSESGSRIPGSEK